MVEIEEAVEGLYSVFSRYPRPLRIESCSCGCTKPNATEPLVAVPLRDISADALEDYAFSAMTTQGSVADFRYLLPRLFEAISTHDLGCTPEILFGKLRYAKWSDWPADEITAIKVYLQALWEKALNSFPLRNHLAGFPEIESLLASIAVTGEPLEPYLQTWTITKDLQADEHLVQFVTMVGSDFSDGRTLHEAFWEECQTQAVTLRKWLLQPKTIERILGAAPLLREDGFEHLFPSALAILRAEARQD